MADETDIDRAAPANGSRINRKVVPIESGSKPVNGGNDKRTPSPPPSPIEEPGKASAAKRSESTEVHKALAINDAERMAAARVFGGELTEVVRDAVKTVLVMQGLSIDDSDLDAILNEKVTAGVRVVKVKHGNAVRPRKLPRVVAIAYGMGGSAASAYERLAAIQTAWPTLYTIVTCVAHTVAIAKGIAEKARALPPPPAPDNGPSEIIDARPIAEDAKEDGRE